MLSVNFFGHLITKLDHNLPSDRETYHLLLNNLTWYNLVNRDSYKIVLLGDPAVGKTSIRKRYLGSTFDKNYNFTLGADFAIKRLENKMIQIWDLAGQPIFADVRAEYYKGAEGLILVFDIGRPDSFTNAPTWLNEMTSISKKIVPIILVGNKVDLRETETDTISPNAGNKYANDLTKWSGFEVQYIESSALTGENIEDIFIKLIEEIKIMKSMEEGA